VPSITCVTTRYLPNLRHIARLFEADQVVLLDLAPVPHRNKSSFINRNRILDRDRRMQWLTVPIHRQASEIRQVAIDGTQVRWARRHVHALRTSYPNYDALAPGFVDQLEERLTAGCQHLVDLNAQVLELLVYNLCEAAPAVVRQSAIMSSHHPALYRLEAARVLGAETYVSGEVEYQALRDSGEYAALSRAGLDVSRSATSVATVLDDECLVSLSAAHSLLALGLGPTRAALASVTQHLRAARSPRAS
jgi:hypothetical protein